MQAPKEIRSMGLPGSWSCRQLWASPLECWEPSSASPEKHWMFFTVEPSLQHLISLKVKEKKNPLGITWKDRRPMTTRPRQLGFVVSDQRSPWPPRTLSTLNLDARKVNSCVWTQDRSRHRKGERERGKEGWEGGSSSNSFPWKLHHCLGSSTLVNISCYFLLESLWCFLIFQICHDLSNSECDL